MIRLFYEINKQNEKDYVDYIIENIHSYINNKYIDDGFYIHGEFNSNIMNEAARQCYIISNFPGYEKHKKEQISQEEAEVILRKLKEYKRKLENES